MNKETHKQITRHLDLENLDGCSVEYLITFLKNTAGGLEQPKFGYTCGYDYTEYFITGWIPMTPEESAREKRKRAKWKEAVKKARDKKRAARQAALIKEAKELGFNLIKKEK